MDQKSLNWKSWCFRLVALVLIVAFYVITRPVNHAESYDGVTYALIAENYPLGTARDSRNILFHAVNRSLFMTAQSAGLGLRSLDVIALFNIVTASFALLLFARLMRTVFGVAAFTSVVGAAFLGLTYGFWRYAGEAEVYAPSIFLTLCCLTLLFRYLGLGESESDFDASQLQANSSGGGGSGGKLSLLILGLMSGAAVLFYQANLVPLFVASIVLFRWSRFSSIINYGIYSVVAVGVVIAGIVWSCGCINGHFPSINEVTAFMTERNSEFPERSSFFKMALKSVLAFGHDIFTANWTQTLAPVRDALAPRVPGCLYNFKVAEHAGANLQSWTIIAPVLLAPLLFLLARFHWLASRQWVFRIPPKPTLFLVVWLCLMVGVVSTLAPGSFEAWIPMLVPFVGLLTVFVFEPCYRLGQQKLLVAFLVMLLCYNFCGGMLLWRNDPGDSFSQRTAWIRKELGPQDTVLLNEFDFRIVDYLCYFSDVRVSHLLGESEVVTHRSSPQIFVEPLDEFLQRHRQGEGRLFVMGDVLSPSPDIKKCNEGERKFEAGRKLALILKNDATLVNASSHAEIFQIFQESDVAAKDE